MLTFNNGTMKRIALVISLISSLALAAPSLSPYFQDAMVLQRRQANPIWGTAKAGSNITISWQGQNITTKANAKGEWRAELPAMEAKAEGSPLSISNDKGTKVIQDILVGEVWLASGQSNMEWAMKNFSDGRVDAKEFNIPQLRIMTYKPKLHTAGGAYSVEDYKRILKAGEFRHEWQSITPQSTPNISAVACYFGRALQAELGVPVGIICNAVGGSGMEAWLPQELLKIPAYKSLKGETWMQSPLVNDWVRGRAAANLKNVMEVAKKDKLPLVHPFKPTYLFENTVRPLAPVPLAGVIWYQGESNAEATEIEGNEKMIKSLIKGWRAALGKPKLPFIMVQLPRINDTTPLRICWPEFREAQERTASGLSNVGIICTLDLGEAQGGNVHPSPKKPVGERLAQRALDEVYGKPSATYPRIIALAQEKGKTIITLDQECVTTDGGTCVNGF